MVDFHTHSNMSDGDLSPAVLVKEAVKQGLSALALTDHDTIDGLETARITAKEENIRFIPGIEVNINWTRGDSARDVPRGAPGLGPGGEFHLLGLGINSPTPAFISAVKDLANRREIRNRKILDLMVELSMINQDDQQAVWDELLTIAKGKSVINKRSDILLGRPHFAVLLIKLKIVKNIKQAFARYLGVGKPLYVPKEGLSFEEAAALIRGSGGIPVLAHPNSLFVAWGRLPDLIKTLKDMGLMGLEAWHPTAKQSFCRRLEAFAKSLGLYVTEGSDFHGSIRSDRKLGYSSKGRKIDDYLLKLIPELI
jgi:predicted metal-dependent phosphoesterase TrpH